MRLGTLAWLGLRNTKHGHEGTNAALRSSDPLGTWKWTEWTCRGKSGVLTIRDAATMRQRGGRDEASGIGGRDAASVATPWGVGGDPDPPRFSGASQGAV